MDKYINIKDLEAMLTRVNDEFDSFAPSYCEEDEYSRKWYGRGWSDLRRKLFKELKQLPCVEVAPAGYYEWLLTKHAEENYHKCSYCGVEYQLLPPTTIEDIKKAIKRCPACGATMI